MVERIFRSESNRFKIWSIIFSDFFLTLCQIPIGLRKHKILYCVDVGAGLFMVCTLRIQNSSICEMGIRHLSEDCTRCEYEYNKLTAMSDMLNTLIQH
jgi:hypothetical protein